MRNYKIYDFTPLLWQRYVTHIIISLSISLNVKRVIQDVIIQLN